jgi:hypothetical protein
MKKVYLFIVLFCSIKIRAQILEQIISLQEVSKIETTLASNEMEGRKTFTPGIEKAANFIAAEFEKVGLNSFQKENSYFQKFSLIKAKYLGIEGTINGNSIDARNIVAFTCKPHIQVTEKDGYEVLTIKAGDNLIIQARNILALQKNVIVEVDTVYAKQISSLIRWKSQMNKTENNVIFVVSASPLTTYIITAKHEITEMPLANIVGCIPGKTKPNEYVIFSGHYDHLGIISKDRAGNVLLDSIFNGANDDASGITAIIMLARYFKAINNNERTLLFVAFTAEEIGMYGSQYFSKQLNPAEVIAMFNIEMIGTESKWGRNSAYITGFDKTDMGTLMQTNLAGTAFNFYPDPYPQQQLFFRSDNATLARAGVPAHTISTSKMDAEPNYHKASDEVSTLDLENMTAIIQSIAISAKGFVSGSQTPTRVDGKKL